MDAAMIDILVDLPALSYQSLSGSLVCQPPDSTFQPLLAGQVYFPTRSLCCPSFDDLVATIHDQEISNTAEYH